MKLGRKHLGRFLAVAVGGVLAGSAVACKQEASKSDDGGGSKAAPAGEKHACKGMNACKGQGGCKPGDAGCAGKNSCKGKGGCAVPVKH